MNTKPHSHRAFRWFMAVAVLAAVARAPAQTVWSNALSFDGLDDYVQSRDDINLANQSFSIETWAQRRSTSTMDLIVGQGGGGFNRTLMFGFHYYGGNQFVFDFYGNGVESGSAETDNGWHYWAGTYDAPTRVRCLYRDGMMVACNTNSADHYQGGGPIRIGVGYSGEAPNQFDGHIDEVRIWNVALSAEQVAENMRHPLSGAEPGLLAYWRFDEGTGTITLDATANRYEAVLLNGPTWTSSGLPEAPGCNVLSFDGANDYVVFNRPVSNDFTLECWFRSTQQKGYETQWWEGMGLIDGEVAGAVPDFGLTLGAGKVLFGTGGSTVGTYDQTIRSGFVADGQWRHVAATRELASGAMRLYINGTLVASGTGGTRTLDAPPQMRLGSVATGLNFFQGQIDEVRIWNTVRSQQQIQADLAHPLSGSEFGLAAYYRLDDRTGSIAYDATAGHWDATLVNSPVWTNSALPPFLDIRAAPSAVETGTAAAWGDYDNDGRLDVLLSGRAGSTGPSVVQVWRNTGTGFANINAGLPGSVPITSAAWGDYDNDGRLDILLTGFTGSSGVAQVWRNNGNGTFSDINARLPAVHGQAAWGDYDNDGRLDILLAGNAGTPSSVVPVAQIWRNTGTGWTNINAGLTGVFNSAVAWGDYDNDGWLDILLTGWLGGRLYSEVWRNTGTGFTNINASLPPVMDGSVAWGDYDNDADLDILITGYNWGGFIAQVRRNDGNGNFNDINAGLPGVFYGEGVWGDYDNDGWMDILLTGAWSHPDFASLAQVWRNNGNGTFTDIKAGLPGVNRGQVSWGDYDKDGRLDILQVGSGAGEARIWRNIGPTPNSGPEPPTGLTTSGDTLSWNPASDAQTPQSGLSYNVRIGTTNNGADIVSPQAALDSGTRRVPALGNAQLGESALACLPFGIYYWSVQAVDTTFAGSAFAPEQRLVVAAKTLAATGVELTSARFNGTIHPLSRLTSAWFEWGETSEYGRTTPVLLEDSGASPLPVSCIITGLTAHSYHYRMMASNDLGIHSGNDNVIAMRLERPQVSTLAAADVAPTRAKFQGAVNPRERETRVWFEYGLTTKYGHLSQASIVAGGPTIVPVGTLVSDLLPWMTYHYRIVASNIVGVTTGADMSVTLPGPSFSGPLISALPNVSIPQGGSTSVVFSVSDPDTPLERVLVRPHANNPVLLPNLDVSGVGSTRILTLTPDRTHSGSAVVTVTASDDATTTSRAFALTVAPTADDHSPLLSLTNAQVVSPGAWRFRLVDAGTGSTNYVVEYRPDFSPTNNWTIATNVSGLGAGVFEVYTGPPQPGLGFYRVRGFRLLSGELGLSDITVNEGAGVAGPVLVFNGPYFGNVSYTWTGAWGSSNGVAQVNGTTAVIPVPLIDNSGVDPLRTLTLRLEPGAGYTLADVNRAEVTIDENDADWQGTLVVPNGLADATTAWLTNNSGGFTNVVLPQNANLLVGFTLRVQQASGNFQGWIHSDGSGFFPTNVLAQLTLTENSFSAVATNIPLPPLTGSTLFTDPHRLDLRLDAANAPGLTNIGARQIRGTATMVSVLPGRPYLDCAISGTFLLLKPPVFPSTNEVPLHAR